MDDSALCGEILRLLKTTGWTKRFVTSTTAKWDEGGGYFESGPLCITVSSEQDIEVVVNRHTRTTDLDGLTAELRYWLPLCT
jgi:hypothetical protein